MARNDRRVNRIALTLGALLTAVSATAGTARAQADNITARLEQQLRQAEQRYALRANPALGLDERAVVDYGAIVNFTFFALDDTEQRTRILRQYDNQLFGYVNLDGAHQFYGRLRFQYRDFNPGDSFDGGGDKLIYPLQDRYWYQFDLRRAIEAYEGRRSTHNLTARMGRQYVQWASGLVLSEQVIALDWTAEIGNEWAVRGLFGQTPESTVIDFDSSRPSFDGETERVFLGGMVTWTGWTNHKPYVYAMHQWDHNDEDFANLTLFGNVVPTSFEYESTYLAAGSNGRLFPRLSYEAEFVYETGEGLSNSFDAQTLGAIDQTHEEIDAWAARGLLRYSFNDDNLTELQFESIFASGDEDRVFDTSDTFGGNQPGTNDNAFNAFGFVNTGIAFGAPVSNLMMYRLGVQTFPLRNTDKLVFERWQVGANVFVFNKMNPHAAFDEATRDDRYLGFEFDVYSNWRLTEDVAVFVQYGVFVPGQAIATDKDERHAFITGISYSF